MLATGAASGDVIILDDFTDAPFDETVAAGVVINQQLASVLGGQRDYAASVGANPFENDLNVGADPDHGLAFSAGPGVVGALALQYDGSDDVENDKLPLDPGGGLVLPFADVTSIDLEFHFLDLPMGVTVEIATVDKFGEITGFASLQKVIDPLADPTVVSFDIADFDGDPDFVVVNMINVNFNTGVNPPAAVDFVLRGITIIPSPGPASLCALALLGAVRRRR